MNTVALGLVLLVGASPILVAADAITWSPLPAGAIQGSRAVLTQWNLSVEAPAADWTWAHSSTRQEDAHHRYQIVACRAPRPGVQFVLGASERYYDELDARQAEEFIQGAASSFQQSGWEATIAASEPSTIPLTGSYRYVLDARRAEGQVRVYGYVGAKGRMFTFQHVSAAQDEPLEFRRFVESYRFVGRPLQDPIEGLGQWFLGLSIALTLLLGGCGFVVNKLAGRVVVNLWYLALILLVVGGIALAVSLGPRINTISSPREKGAAWGQVVFGPVLWPALFAIWRARALSRRRAAEQAPLTPRIEGVFD